MQAIFVSDLVTYITLCNSSGGMSTASEIETSELATLSSNVFLVFKTGEFSNIQSILACLMKKYKKIQDFGQGQKYWSDPDVLTLCLTLVVMDVT